MENDVYYFHNIKATVLFPVKVKEKIDWLTVSGNNFSVVENSKRYRFWGKNSYLPLVVLRNYKPWAELDTHRQKLHIITRGSFDEQLQSFVDLLCHYSPDFSIKETVIKYLEICTRYPDKYFDEVRKHIIEAESRFFTTVLEHGEDYRIKGKVWFSRANKLFVDRTMLNIKTYRFVLNFRSKKRTISETILPKIEVQIYNPKSLEEAKQEAIPLIKAFQKHIGFRTMPMLEPEYSLIPDTHLLSHNVRLLNFFNSDNSIKAVKFPKEITKDETAYKIACFITPEAKSSQEIMEHSGIKRATLQRALKKLEPYLEKRGSKGIGIFYQIDINLIDKTLQINKVREGLLITNSNSSNSNSYDSSSNKSRSASLIKPFNSRNGGSINVQANKNHQEASTIQITVEKQPVPAKPVQVTILREKVDFPNQLVNSNLITGGGENL